jgi:hypothetical protein
MTKVKFLRSYGVAKKGDTVEVSPKQLDFLVRNGIVEKVDCKDCEDCEDCKSTKKKRTTTTKKKTTTTKATMGGK